MGYTDSGLFNAGDNGLFSGSDPNGQSLYTLTTLGLLKQDEIRSGWLPALESTFQNIMLSLLSNPVWRKTSDSTSPTPVKVTGFVNVYHYAPTDLYIAYGVSILLTIFCMVVGLIAAIRNDGNSYTNTFSTILRTTRDRSLEHIVFTYEDTTGTNPLDSDIGNIKVIMKHDRDRDKGGFVRVD